MKKEYTYEILCKKDFTYYIMAIDSLLGLLLGLIALIIGKTDYSICLILIAIYYAIYLGRFYPTEKKVT